ncbi:hypothetical protein PENTCL1PPCAC_6297, partial [Pristionchus entomophagus]
DLVEKELAITVNYSTVGGHDQKNNTTTDNDGNFEITGAEVEAWGHIFFLEIRFPCWRSGAGSFRNCKNKPPLICDKHSCEYHVRVWIPDDYYYERRAQENDEHGRLRYSHDCFGQVEKFG